MNIQDIIAKDQQYYMPVFGGRNPVAFEKGEGCTLTDTQGRTYLDFLAGIAVTSLGHSHPRVVDALVSQAQKLIHTSNLYYIKAQAEMVELLIERVGKPSGLARAFVANTGAEANEGMFKLARKYFYKKGSNRYEIITAAQSFHGRTLGTLAATGQPKYQAPYKPLTPGFVHVPYNDIGALSGAITPRTAAILLETIQGEGGVIEGSAEYLQAAQALCEQHGILFLLDEVQTGIGRTGSMLSAQALGLSPHMVSLAKALGNGMPIGAFLAREEVACAFETGDHGTTFGGNPLACAAAAAVLKTMTEPGFLENVQKTGAYFKNRLSALSQKHPLIINVRGRGLLLGAELSPEVSGKEVASKMLEKGVLINCAGQNTLRFAPPLIVTEAQIDTVISLLDEVLP